MTQGIFPFARASYLRYVFLSTPGIYPYDDRPPLPHPRASRAASAGGQDFVEKPRAVALAGNLSKTPTRPGTAPRGGNSPRLAPYDRPAGPWLPCPTPALRGGLTGFCAAIPPWGARRFRPHGPAAPTVFSAAVPMPPEAPALQGRTKAHEHCRPTRCACRNPPRRAQCRAPGQQAHPPAKRGRR